MPSTRTVQFKPQHIVSLVVIVAVGLIVGFTVGPWWGLGAAVVALGVSEAVERRARSRRVASR